MITTITHRIVLKGSGIGTTARIRLMPHSTTPITIRATRIAINTLMVLFLLSEGWVVLSSKLLNQRSLSVRPERFWVSIRAGSMLPVLQACKATPRESLEGIELLPLVTASLFCSLRNYVKSESQPFVKPILWAAAVVSVAGL